MGTRYFFVTALVAVIASAITASTASAQQPRDFDAFFKRLDRNEDGKVSKDELPKQAQKNFARIDRDGDGFASRDEIKTIFERMQRNRQRGGQQRGPRVPESVERHADINYAGTENERQTLDLLLPKDRASNKPLPVVVFIHGGGWRGGHKNSGVGRVVPLVQSGRFAGVSVGYRLTNEAQWPQQIHDCKAAIRWVRANAKKHGLDPDRIAVWGTSAGGHLVAMLGTSGDIEHLEGDLGPHTDVSSRVTCVIDFFGPADMATMGKSPRLDHMAPDSPEALLLGGAIPDKPRVAADASPQTFVTKDDPPFLIMHGDKDPTVPVEQSISFDKKLDEAGVDSTLIIVKGGGHGFHGEKISALVNRFLDKHLRGVGAELSDGEVADEPRQRSR